MARIALPAREMLALPGQTSIAWAAFDAAWYLGTYRDARAELGDAEEAAVLRFYLEHGQRRGHSPNIWFDEAWHLKLYPGVAAAVREGHAESGFDAYCRVGFRRRSPHWLFHELSYRQRYPDLRDDALRADGSANGYDHYLRHGSREGRIGHMLFDPAVYCAGLDVEQAACANAQGAYLHYLRRLHAGPTELATSRYFDPRWYLERYPIAAEAIAGGRYLCALHHYLANDMPTAFDPLPEFSEAYYLDRYRDVAAAVAAEDRRNGYDHFLHDGITELRSPSAAIDLRYYATEHPSVRRDVNSGRARDVFAHLLTIGRSQGLARALPPEDRVTERQAVVLNRRRAENLLPMAARTVLDFSCGAEPAISVVMIVRDQLPLTWLTLASLRANYPGAIELVLIDVGPRDATDPIGRFVRGASVLRFDAALDFVHCANAALNCVGADAVLFLDSALELAPGAIDAALRRLRSDARIGAVGGKLVRADGRLESAGGIVWRDGTTMDYLRDASPLAPEANFAREVDFVPFAFLLARAELLREIDGFDETLTDGCPEADLCLRMTAAGARVMYDPAIVVSRLRPSGAGSHSEVAPQPLLEGHAERLRLHHTAGQREQVFARSSAATRRVLFIDDMLPLRRFGSGFVRSNDLIRVMASLGYGVTIYPMMPCEAGLAGIYADLPDTVEVMHDRAALELPSFLSARRGYYDTIWIARTHNLDRIKPMLHTVKDAAGRPPRLVLDTEAIASIRESGRAALTDAAFELDAEVRREFAGAPVCDAIVAVSSCEARMLRDLGLANVTVIGHWREAQPTPRCFAQRAGMLFLGAMHQEESPNRDALAWFVCEVLPLVEEALGWETRLIVAGYVAPPISLAAYRNHPRITLRGAVDDVAPLYDAHRIFLAPTRYAAGLPYKVHEAASYGLPVVASALLARQLEWRDGQELVVADTAEPAEFARRIVALYRDPALWQRLRDNALERVRAENRREQYAAAVRQAVEG